MTLSCAVLALQRTTQGSSECSTKLAVIDDAETPGTTMLHAAHLHRQIRMQVQFRLHNQPLSWRILKSVQFFFGIRSCLWTVIHSHCLSLALNKQIITIAA